MKMALFIILVLTLLAIPATANAKTHHTPRISSVGKYTYTTHRAQHIKCPFVGCKSLLNQR